MFSCSFLWIYPRAFFPNLLIPHLPIFPFPGLWLISQTISYCLGVLGPLFTERCPCLQAKVLRMGRISPHHYLPLELKEALVISGKWNWGQDLCSLSVPSGPILSHVSLTSSYTLLLGPPNLMILWVWQILAPFWMHDHFPDQTHPRNCVSNDV